MKVVPTLTDVCCLFCSFQNAAYLIEKEGLPITDKVLEVLSLAGYDDPTSKKVMIESTNSSVLMKFRDESNYELVYRIEEDIQDAEDAALKDIKDFANSVVISKASVFPESSSFLSGVTNVVPKLQSHGLSVYVETFSNEFVSQAWDFFSDSTVEINSYVMGVNISGVITEFPLTSARYKSKSLMFLVYMQQYRVNPGRSCMFWKNYSLDDLVLMKMSV
jgi:hypothetical protein